MSTASSEPPIALRIPPELWVLVSEELEYIDLKRLAGACKAFKAMLEVSLTLLEAYSARKRCSERWLTTFPQQPHYGERLFFKPPTGQLEPGTDLAIHPILDGLDLIRCEDVDTADFLPPRHRLSAFDYPAADKFATAPACTKIEIVMDDQYQGGTVTCQSGVTVRQVIKRVLEYWNAPVTDHVAARVRAEFNLRKDYPVKRRTWNNCKEFDLYKGWEYVEVQADGVTVLLASTRFDR